MNASNYRPVDRAAALFCLLAVAFLYAPVALAALPAQVPACCRNGMCPMRMHHGKAARNMDMPMDCAHEISRTAVCPFSCCHTMQNATVMGHIFVLPQAEEFAAPSGIAVLAPFEKLSEVLRFTAPPSPPPRIASLAR